MKKRFLARIGGLSAFLLVVACATTDFVTGQKVNNMYSVEEDVQLGSEVLQQSMAEMEKEKVPIDRDKRKLNQIQEIVGKLSLVSHMPDLPYEVHLFEDDKIVNAMCAPGGKVMVFSGLYHGKDAIVHNEEELAIVLGHELAHATCRHTTESITREMPINLLLLAGGLYAESQDNRDVATAIGAAFVLVQGVWFPKYSRRDEAEADAVGLMYAARAGYDPRAAPRLWKQVYEEQGDSPALLKFMSSHPSNKDRWKALEKQLPAALLEYEKATGKPAGSIPPTI